MGAASVATSAIAAFGPLLAAESAASFMGDRDAHALSDIAATTTSADLCMAGPFAGDLTPETPPQSRCFFDEAFPGPHVGHEGRPQALVAQIGFAHRRRAGAEISISSSAIWKIVMQDRRTP